MAAITIKRGDDDAFLLTFQDDNDAIRPLTNMTVWLTVKQGKPSAPDTDLDDASAQLRYYWVHDGSTVTGSAGLSLPAGATAEDGQLQVEFPSDLTTTLPKITIWPYDIQVKLPSGRVKTWDEGTLSVDLDLTRRITTP